MVCADAHDFEYEPFLIFKFSKMRRKPHLQLLPPRIISYKVNISGISRF